MKLDEKQMNAAFDTLTAETWAKRQRAQLLHQKAELARTPFTWRFAASLAAAAVFTLIWSYLPDMVLLGLAATILILVAPRIIWHRKVADRIKDIDAQINAIKH